MLKKEKTNLDRQGPKECEEERVGERGRVFVKDSEKERESACNLEREKE